MSNQNNGGPAFGRTYAEVERDRMQLGMEPSKTPFGHDGMTLRDYFAAKAMQGFCGSGEAAPTAQHHFDNLAEDAYRLADAMLSAREGK